jgi:hypothetical protein
MKYDGLHEQRSLWRIKLITVNGACMRWPAEETPTRQRLPLVHAPEKRTARHGAPDRLEQAGGTELGLTITRSLVETHGGQLTVVSTPGQGSTFSVTLATTPVGEHEKVGGMPPGRVIR